MNEIDEDDLTTAARMAYEANRLWCREVGDPIAQPWEHATEADRESYFRGIDSMLSGAAPSPEDQHRAWAISKTDAGWVFGKVKDATATPPTHPCLVPYAELPKDQQVKDALFRAVVSAVLGTQGG